ncbi:hypothetical protein LJB99_00115 [Deltaproteobacteria bacterium OttesenSCG-928-K17]|nr:hypothetical protein [Deltaproteobacteria bacterium OttesenSCG-928-K17]
MQQRRDALETISQQDARLFKAVSDKWEQTRKKIKGIPMTRRDRQQVMKKFNEQRSAELKALRNQIKSQRDEIRDKYPFKNWSGYLQHLAGQGNETALAILRSKNNETLAEKPAAPILLSAKSQDNVPAIVTQATELLRHESPSTVVKTLDYTIDGKGTVIIKLPDGGNIRYTGAEIHFSNQSGRERQLAEKLARLHWGKSVEDAKGLFQRKTSIEIDSFKREVVTISR